MESEDSRSIRQRGREKLLQRWQHACSRRSSFTDGISPFNGTKNVDIMRSNRIWYHTYACISCFQVRNQLHTFSTKLLSVLLITSRPRTHLTHIVHAGVVDFSHQHHEWSRGFAADIVKPVHLFHFRPLRICVGDDASEFGNIFQWMGVPGVLQRHICRAFPMYYLLSLRSSRYHTLFGCLRRLAS